MATKRKKAEFPGRPWMLGTDEIPPPLRVPYQMWSRSSDPHQCGLIKFEFTEEGLAVGWWPDGLFAEHIIEWHELAWVAGQKPRDVTAEIDWLREQAVAEATKDVMDKARDVVEAWVEQQSKEPIVSPFRRALLERCCSILERSLPPAFSPTSSPR